MQIAHHQRTTWCILFALLLVLQAPLAYAAADHDTTHHLSSLTRASLKTMTFQAAANLSDALIFSAIVGADATASAIFFAANTASAMAVYLPYELAWDALGPPPEVTTVQTIMVKTTGYQAITSVRNLALSYAFAGTLLASATFAVTVVAVDAAIYALNEYAWDIFNPRTPSTSNQPTVAP